MYLFINLHDILCLTAVGRRRGVIVNILTRRPECLWFESTLGGIGFIFSSNRPVPGLTQVQEIGTWRFSYAARTSVWEGRAGVPASNAVVA